MQQQKRKEIIVLEKNPDGTIRIFGNPNFERWSHTHPIVPLFVWIPVIAGLIWSSVAIHGYSVSELALIAFAALFFWTFVEYTLHRFVFHFKPWSSFTRKVSYLIHWVHHDAPQEKTRLVMPPVGAIVLASILYPLFGLVTGPRLIQPFFAFFLVGYLSYDYIHYAVHHFRPRTALGRWLKKNHMDHHYTYQDSNWGVSNPLWDYVFGTTTRRVIREVRGRQPGRPADASTGAGTQSTA